MLNKLLQFLTLCHGHPVCSTFLSVHRTKLQENNREIILKLGLAIFIPCILCLIAMINCRLSAQQMQNTIKKLMLSIPIVQQPPTIILHAPLHKTAWTVNVEKLIYLLGLFFQSLDLFGLVQFCSELSRLVQACPGFFRHVQISSDLFKLIQTCSHSLRLAQNRSDLFLLIHTRLDLSRLVQTCPDSFRLAQTCSALEKSYCHLPHV